MSACVLFFIRCSNLTTVLYVPLHVYRTGNTPVTAVFEFSVDQGKLAVVMDQLNGKQSLTTTALFTLQLIDFKKCPCKRAQLFSLSTSAFLSFPISSFVSFFLSRSFLILFFFFFNVVPCSAHFHVAGPDKWIRGPWQVIAVVQHVQEYVFSIKFWLCFSLPAAHSYQVYLDTKTLIGPRANKAPFTRRRCENDRYEIVPIRKEIFPDRPPVYTKTIRIRKLLKTIRRR